MSQESPEVKPKANAARPPSFWRRFGMQFGIWSVGLVMWLAFVVSAPSSFTHKEIYLAFAATTPIFALMAIPLTLVVINGAYNMSLCKDSHWWRTNICWSYCGNLDGLSVRIY